MLCTMITKEKCLIRTRRISEEQKTLHHGIAQFPNNMQQYLIYKIHLSLCCLFLNLHYKGLFPLEACNKGFFVGFIDFLLFSALKC